MASNADATSFRRVSPGLLALTGSTIFVVNAGLLVLQLLAGRYLAPFIGSSVETWTSVIGVFLTGIAVGNWVGGRVADRYPSSKTLAVLLLLGAFSSLLMMGLMSLLQSWTAYAAIPLTPRIPILSLVFCLIPAVLLSMITPLVIKLSLADVRLAGSVAGVTFALSTLGCLLGNYLTGFVLMANYTLDSISLGVAISLVLLAVIQFLLPYQSPQSVESAEEQGVASATVADSGGWLNLAGNIRIAFAIVFLCSFCGMTLELTASRILAPIIGVSIYSWTGIIGVMLAGTATGNYLGGVLADRGYGEALKRLALLLCPLVGFALAWPLLTAAGYAPTIASKTEDLMVPDESRAMTFRLFGAGAGILVALLGWGIVRIPGGTWFNWMFVGGMVGAVLVIPGLHRLDRMLHTKTGQGDAILTVSWFESWKENGFDPQGMNHAAVKLHLIGFAIGAAFVMVMILVNLWLSKGPSQTREKNEGTTTLSVTLFLASLFSMAIILILANLRNRNFLESLGLVEEIIAWTFALFFLPMIMLGTISPQVIRLSVPNMANAGRTVGSIYAWSTVGAIVGTFATGYFLIQAFGMFRVVLIVSLLLSVLTMLVGQLWKNNALLYAWSIVVGGATVGVAIIREGGENYDLETKYYAIKVKDSTDYTTGRPYSYLVLDHLIHSSAMRDDPTWLYYKHEYIQAEVLQLARTRHAKPNMLVVGGGGYTLPKFVELLMPEVNTEVVEIDPGVTKVAFEKLWKDPQTNIKSFNMDGRQFIKEIAPKAHYQLVVQDAVNDLSVPYHLLTKEYNDGVKAILTEDGAYMLTFIDSVPAGKLWRAAAHTMKETFPYVYLLGQEENFWQYRSRQVAILYGSMQPLDREAIEKAHDGLKPAYKSFRRKLRDRYDDKRTEDDPPFKDHAPELRFYTHVLPQEKLDEFLEEILEGDEMKPYKAIVLTDQYAPVDNLMSGIFRARK